MTAESIAIAVGLFSFAIYAYLVFPVWVAVVCANTTFPTRRTKMLWMIACIVLAPLGSWAFCIATQQRLHFRITTWISIAGTIGLTWFFAAFTGAVAEAVRMEAEAVTIRVGRAQMPIDGSQRAEILADLDTLRSEIHGGVIAFRQTDAAAGVVDLLEQYLEDGRLTPGECEDWIQRYKARGGFH